MVVILPLLTASRNDADSHVPDCHTRVSWWTTLYGVTQVLLCAKSRLPKNRDKQVWILLVYLGRIRGEKAARSYLMRRARASWRPAIGRSTATVGPFGAKGFSRNGTSSDTVTWRCSVLTVYPDVMTTGTSIKLERISAATSGPRHDRVGHHDINCLSAMHIEGLDAVRAVIESSETLDASRWKVVPHRDAAG
jgi:hypothetical protein